MTTITPGALFGGLVFNEAGEPAEVTRVGGSAQYVILDDGFRRHVEANEVDLQVLRYMREQMEPFRDEAVQEMMRMIGRDDLFTKVMIDSSIDNIEQALDQTLPEEVRVWLGMMGFRVVVDYHGEVVQIDMPSQAAGWDE
jgi:hypothetical protein